MNPPIRPMVCLSEIYGPGRVYAPRAHPDTCEWVSADPVLLDALTGNQLCVAGTMPVVCSAGFGHPAALELLDEAGLAPAPNRLPFRAGRSVEAAREALRRAAGDKLVLQHAYPPGVLPPDAQWVEPRLLAFLNNKAHLPELAPTGHVPPRRVVDRAAFFARPGDEPLPYVLKAVSDHSSGAGVAVHVCHAPADVAAAAKQFAGCERVVVESFLCITQNPCLHFAVMPDGAVRYLGFAEQDVTEAGGYVGNWMRLGEVLPRHWVDVARAVVTRGAAMGFRGVAGVDLAGTSDGQVYVLDLNFRVNGSTAAALLAPALRAARGPLLMHVRGFRCAAGIDALLAVVRAMVREGRLLPISLFDPVLAGHSSQPARMNAFIFGETRDAIAATEARLAAAGVA